MIRPNVLVFAGADPSGGAGLQADIEAIGAIGAHALPVVTVLTVQDNDRVFGITPIAADLVRKQAQVLIDKMDIAAVKIGIVGNRANAEAIAELIRALRQRHPEMPVVVDTVLASGHGDALSTEDAVQVLMPLLALASVVTPNLPEAEALCGERDTVMQAAMLLRLCPNVLIKGGHGSGDEIVNRWFGKDESQDGTEWRWARLPGEFHGTGCTLASALAALLARGKSMPEAMYLAQTYVHDALQGAYAIADGQRIPNRHVSTSEAA